MSSCKQASLTDGSSSSVGSNVNHGYSIHATKIHSFNILKLMIIDIICFLGLFRDANVQKALVLVLRGE